MSLASGTLIVNSTMQLGFAEVFLKILVCAIHQKAMRKMIQHGT